MGKPTGFLELDRVERTYLPVRDRLKNFREFTNAPPTIHVKDCEALFKFAFKL